MFRVFILRLLGVALGLGQAFAADPYSGPDFNALVRKADPLTPVESLKAFAVPDGFEMELVAASPDIGQPMNLAFDERGRLWVSSTLEYPYPAPPDRKGRDTIKVFKDTTGDGRYDKISIFADGLNIPTGVYPYKDGVIAWSIPNIWFLRDTDGDGDGSADCVDGCPSDANKSAPGICGCGVADTNSDNDSTPDCNDACPLDDNKTEEGI